MSEWVSGNIFIRQGSGEASGHEHNFAHTTFFTSPYRVDVELPNGKVLSKNFPAGGHALIMPYGKHTLTPLPLAPPEHLKDVLRVLDAFLAGNASIEDLAAARKRSADVSTNPEFSHYYCIYSHREPQAPEARINTGWGADQLVEMFKACGAVDLLPQEGVAQSYVGFRGACG